MPGPGTFIFMAIPVLIAAGLVGRYRKQFTTVGRIRGLWLVPIVVIGTVVVRRVQASGAGDDPLTNRLLAGLVLAVCVGFVWMNRTEASRLCRAGVWLTGVGACCNAVAVLIYGYMPVYEASARWLGSGMSAGTNPDSKYLATDGAQVPALVLGDVLPIGVSGHGLVVSVGDLLLVAGCTILLAGVFAALIAPLPPEASKPLPR